MPCRGSGTRHGRGPERDGDLLVFFQVSQCLLEELVGDVDRLLVNDGLHADGGSVGVPSADAVHRTMFSAVSNSSLTSWVIAAMMASFLEAFVANSIRPRITANANTCFQATILAYP